jgi:1,4-alpha-glucan branching enzyme
MQKLNEIVFREVPGVLMIAEESTDWPLVSYPIQVQGLGYNYKWNMGWMNDTLRYMKLDFNQRPYHHQLLTFSLTYAFSENYVLPLSHDEVVHGKRSLLSKMPGDYEQKFAGLRTLLGYFFCHPGKKLLFMGGEFAQFIEWRDAEGLDWLLLKYEAHRKFKEYVSNLNKFYQKEIALWEIDSDWEGFEWIDADNWKQSVLVFSRKTKDPQDFLIVILNFQPQGYPVFRIGVPSDCRYKEVFNSDLQAYGGKTQKLNEVLEAEQIEWQGQKFSVNITLPSLTSVILKPMIKIEETDGLCTNKIVLDSE